VNDMSLTPRMRALAARQFPDAVFESGICKGRTREPHGKSTPCAGMYAHARYCKGGKPWCRMMLPRESPIGTIMEIVGHGKNKATAFRDAIHRRSRRAAAQTKEQTK
jgi:hypothetical protein